MTIHDEAGARFARGHGLFDTGDFSGAAVVLAELAAEADDDLGGGFCSPVAIATRRSCEVTPSAGHLQTRR